MVSDFVLSHCRFISASPWWAQLNSWEQTTHTKCVWELEAFTGYLLHHLYRHRNSDPLAICFKCISVTFAYLSQNGIREPG
jgi:hypothetical protein